MVARTTSENGRNASNNSIEKARNREHVRLNERFVESEPQSATASIIAVGASVPLGLGLAALATTLFGKNEKVAIASWVAVAIVGSASVISAAAVSHRRIVSIGRGNDRVDTSERSMDKSPDEVVGLG